jgi:hypothetical protein
MERRFDLPLFYLYLLNIYPMTMDLNKIIKKPEKKREEEEKEKKETPPASSYNTYDLPNAIALLNLSYHYKIFRKFKYTDTLWFWVTTVTIAILSGIPLTDDFDGFELGAKVCRYIFSINLTLFFSYILYLELSAITGLEKFKRWTKNIEFKVEGWDAFINHKDFVNAEYWWLECKINIQLKNVSSQNSIESEALKALCYLFCLKPKKQYYKPDSEERRHIWKHQDFQLSGSSNVRVATYIYKFISRDLKKFHRHTGLIEKVIITAQKMECVSTESSD